MTKVEPKNVAEEEDKGLESDIVMIEGEYQSLVNETTKKHGTVSKNDFKLLSVIGKGSYGKVFLVKKNGEETNYAMKVLKKEELKKRN